MEMVKSFGMCIMFRSHMHIIGLAVAQLCGVKALCPV